MKKFSTFILSMLSVATLAQPIYKQEVYPGTQTLKIDTKTFINDYQENVDSLLGSFKLNNEAPLNARIFDIADKHVYSFLESSARWKTHGEMMANMYYPNFFVNSKPTSFCFILYDSNSPLLEGYSRVLNYNEILDYLTFHEMGHCLEDYISQTTGKKFSDNREDTELFADIFAMANLLYLKKEEQAEKVVKINEAADKKDYHYQPQRLKRALEMLRGKNINELVGKPNVNKIVDISKETFYSLKQTELINPIFASNKEMKIQAPINNNSNMSGFTIIRK